MLMMCLVNIIVCNYTGKVCDEHTRQYPANCKVIKQTDSQYQVNCNKYIKRKYRLADNKLNFIPQWVDKGLCDHRLLED